MASRKGPPSFEDLPLLPSPILDYVEEVILKPDYRDLAGASHDELQQFLGKRLLLLELRALHERQSKRK